MVLAQRIKTLMEQKEITMYRLSKEVGVHQTTVSNWINGKSTPKIEQLQCIAKVLDVSFADLLGVATLIDGVYTPEELGGYTVGASLSPAAFLVGRAYEKAAPAVQRTVEVALEPYMEKADSGKGPDDPQ